MAAFETIWRLAGVIIDSGIGFERFYARFFNGSDLRVLTFFFVLEMPELLSVWDAVRDERAALGAWCLEVWPSSWLSVGPITVLPMLPVRWWEDFLLRLCIWMGPIPTNFLASDCATF